MQPVTLISKITTNALNWHAYCYYDPCRKHLTRGLQCYLLEPQGEPWSPVELGLGGGDAEKAKNQNLLDHPGVSGKNGQIFATILILQIE